MCLFTAGQGKFISIHSPHARGDTGWLGLRQEESVHFNPLPSCEGRPSRYPEHWSGVGISIHSPHARGDESWTLGATARSSFQSTPLMRGETPDGDAQRRLHKISIHSPHARGDAQHAIRTGGNTDFNPLPSCEGRPFPQYSTVNFWQFQSTPLMRGETFCWSG